jgi:hypothetical protein
MNRPNYLLVTAAVLFLVAALPLLFAPAELQGWAGFDASPTSSLLLQVLGSALFGFAMLDWLARYARIDGIFGRPLLMANLAHTASAALLLGHAVIGGNRTPLVLTATAGYAILAAAFGSRLFAAGETQKPFAA